LRGAVFLKMLNFGLHKHTKHLASEYLSPVAYSSFSTASSNPYIPVEFAPNSCLCVQYVVTVTWTDILISVARCASYEQRISVLGALLFLVAHYC
jgi:hypothetical protein